MLLPTALTGRNPNKAYSNNQYPLLEPLTAHILLLGKTL